MIERRRFLAAVVAGLVGLAISIEIVKALATHSPADSFDAVIGWVGTFQWLETYQTLIAGLAALLAARWSVRAILLQIKKDDRAVRAQMLQVERIEKERKEAKHTAARATLPLSLSALSNYAQTCGLLLHGLLRSCQDEILPASVKVPEFPTLPDGAIATIKELVEFSDPALVRTLSQLTAKLQVQSSRLRGLKRDLGVREIVNQQSLEAYALDAVEIYARCSELFAYGRFENEEPPPELTVRTIANAVHSIGIFDDFYEILVERWKRMF
ncbi:hypothetical protein CN157_04970 [Sinorhizobium meliloti]|uniref:hypothetical protein n=1 Tax=Rhizobium meliloti TaxID=382 RepID=UPI000FDC3DA8|nr:hypothetical protein [Sinorhizobium meliloti]RVK81371.1 hypothetical protein CN157_04970 [Sinorhizobium meliloti]RVQ77993.1 hypothetical protein CN061_06875 [Sinorhizobium meliloti]